MSEKKDRERQPTRKSFFAAIFITMGFFLLFAFTGSSDPCDIYEERKDLGEIKDFQVSSGFWHDSCTVETESKKISLSGDVCSSLSSNHHLLESDLGTYDIIEKDQVRACRGEKNGSK